MEQQLDQIVKVRPIPVCPDNGEIRSLVDLSPLPAILLDAEQRILALNKEARHLLVCTDEKIEGSRLLEYVRSPESMLWLQPSRRPANQGVLSGTFEFQSDDGTSSLGEGFARFFSDGSCLLLINNITERKKAEKSMLASEKQRWKMERTAALEKLAGGIAHDFNNSLAIILLQTDMLSLQLPTGSPQIGRVNEIRSVCNDAASIVRHLLAFGRRQALNPSPVVLNELLENSYRDFRALLGETIELVLDLDAELGVSFVDRGQIAQALMHLGMHARDAMANGGTLTIKTSNIEKGGHRIHKTQGSGAYVQIEVIDTGGGIDPKTQDHLFEPFFSKKGNGMSAGLGLATVYGIIKQSGGFIWATSVTDVGTTFKIQFPRIDQPKQASMAMPEKHSASQMQTILLVDDEISIRKVAAEGLRQTGYRVLEAVNGMDAVDIARTFPDPIHLILADYSMPVMNGVEAAKRIRQYHSDAKVLYISGDPATFGDDVHSQDSSNFLGKPFALSSLTRKVLEVLSS